MVNSMYSNYSSVVDHREQIAEEVDRLHNEGAIFWYQPEDEPPDLCFCPLSFRVQNGRLRLIMDWSNPDADINHSCDVYEVFY